MAEIVQEQMGDILAAYGISELADHIVPIPVECPMEEENQAEEEKEEEEEKEKQTDQKDAENAANEMKNDDEDTKPSDSADKAGGRNDKKTEEQMDIADTSSSASSMSEDRIKQDTSPSTDSEGALKQENASQGKPSPKVFSDLGLVQSAVSLLGDQDLQRSGEVLTCASQPVMTPAAKDWPMAPTASAAPPVEDTESGTPSVSHLSTLNSMEEFHSFFDRVKEARELVQIKRKMLARDNCVPPHKCPRLSVEQCTVLGVGKEVYECRGCSDTFLFKASLDAHTERKTALISVHCKWCKGRQNLVFFNKCTFLAHFQKHAITKRDMQFTTVQASITPARSVDAYKIFARLNAPAREESVPAKTSHSANSLPHHSTNLQQPKYSVANTVVSSSFQKTADKSIPKKPSVDVFNKTMPNDTAKTTGNSPTSNRTTIVINASGNETQSRNKAGSTNGMHCMSCGKKFLSKEAMKDHLQVILIKAPLCQCNVCNMVLGNSCKLRMHTIIHRQSMQQNPCPECGLVFPNLKALLEHQNDGCHHWVSRPLFKCAFCLKYATSYQGLKRHLESNHVDIFFKCTLCQLAFRNNEAATEHSLQVHRLKLKKYGLLYKCPFCKSVYSARAMLEQHFESHFKDGAIKIEKYVYSCVHCNKPFDHVESLKTHMAANHQTTMKKLYNCDLCLLNFTDIDQVFLHRVKCSRRSHVTRPENAKAGDDAGKKSPVRNTQSPPQGTPKVSKVYVCAECDERFPEYNIAALRAHMLQKHSTRIRSPTVNLAAKNALFQSSTKSSPGVLTVNSLRPNMKHESQPRNPSFNSTATTSILQSSFKSPGRLMTVMYPPKGQVQDTHQIPGTPAIPVEIVVKRFTDLQCAKCEHKSNDRVEFEKHIASHKTDDHLSQCHQCGLCFRVQDALRRHMFIKHKIKDMVAFEKRRLEVLRKAEEDLKEKKQEEKEKEGEGKGPAAADNSPPDGEVDNKVEKKEPKKDDDVVKEDSCKFKCEVCKAEFDNDKTFAVHKRSHGLAFISKK
ncbi:zinc finger protein 532-like [Diadema antillarum]|uniref:zinc finger protein 532-like n=1 Tax=Diadema antillarum TaxID=105358 RepID=UPI003A889E25